MPVTAVLSNLARAMPSREGKQALTWVISHYHGVRKASCRCDQRRGVGHLTKSLANSCSWLDGRDHRYVAVWVGVSVERKRGLRVGAVATKPLPQTRRPALEYPHPDRAGHTRHAPHRRAPAHPSPPQLPIGHPRGRVADPRPVDPRRRHPPRRRRPAGAAPSRDVVDAIRYVVRTGCQWDALPVDTPRSGADAR